jgi:hypothetical protein
MFTTYNQLNEGGGSDAGPVYRKKEFREGVNPKMPKRVNQPVGWASLKNQSHKNSNWESLRK